MKYEVMNSSYFWRFKESGMHIYLLDSMQYTPFAMQEGVEFLNDNRIFITVKPSDADVIVGRKFPLKRGEYLKLFEFRRGTNLLIWTHEPRHTTRESKTNFYLPGITAHQMNVYTGDVYLDNYAFIEELKEPLPQMTSSDYGRKVNRIVALVTWIKVRRNKKLWKNGKSIDIALPRQDFLLEGHRKGYVDIFGANWPKNIAQGDTRFQDDWPDMKVRIASDYLYCMAMENTDWPYYVTEKIWQAIVAGCLPIYAGSGGTIYEDFEKGSFIDYAEFESNQECFDFIYSMGKQRFLERYNACVESANAIYHKMDTQRYFPGCMMKGIVDKLHDLRQGY